jgi:hypothetical protein
MPATKTVVGPTVVATADVDRPYSVVSPNSTVTVPRRAALTEYSATNGLAVEVTLPKGDDPHPANPNSKMAHEIRTTKGRVRMGGTPKEEKRLPGPPV